jgi:hypothetical protein
MSDVINRAADSIEQHPERYNFGSPLVSDNPRIAQCMLGRIGQVAGVRAGTHVNYVAAELLKIPASTFYQQVEMHAGSGEACHNALLVPKAMRSIAKRYRGIPLVVSEIFDVNKVKEMVW